MSRPTDTRPLSRPSWYQRFFASLMSAEQKIRVQDYDARKRTLLSDLRGDVLEIGPGAGANLPYYAKEVRWVGLDPNTAMFPYLQKEAQQLGMTIQVREGQAEQIDAADNSLDAVVSTLVLCSVSDPQRVLQEIRRVLKPGGRFVFIEHVAAPRQTRTRRFQRLVMPVWTPLASGCHPDRETWTTIEDAGFSSVHFDHFRLPVPIVGPHIAGYAVK